MEILTIQNKSILKDIDKGKVAYPCDVQIIKDHLTDKFLHSYDWMVKKMYQNGVNNSKTLYPFWGWAIFDYSKNLDDVAIDSWKAYSGYSTNKVIIKMDIPDNEVLLSDYNMWHCVLNNIYCNNMTTEQTYDDLNDAYDKLPPNYKYFEMVTSWDNIFNITEFTNEFCNVGRYVQATFWEINPKNIIYIK